MKTFNTLLPLVLAGSVAFAGQAGQTAPKPPQHKAPLSMSHPTAAPPSTSEPKADMKAEPKSDMKAEPKAEMKADAAAPATKISKEQAGTIAAGSLKGSEVSSSKLEKSGGKQVWAVTLMQGGKKHEVLVDANEGTIVMNETKHTKHHKESAPTGKH